MALTARWPKLVALAALVAVVIASPAAADDASAPTEAAEAGDPWARGASALPAPRPRAMPVRACSFRRPACVHGPNGAEREVLEVLRAVEASFAATDALRLPRPDPDVATGALDVYLSDHDDDDARVRLASRDPTSAFDRASAFVEMPRRLSGCPREAAAQRAVLHAILLRVGPASSEGIALATSSHLTRLLVPCAVSLLDDVGAFQLQPTTALVESPAPTGDRERERAGRRRARGAALFFDWADARFGAEPGGLVRAGWALGATQTRPGDDAFVAEPDLFDVVDTSFKNVISVGSGLDDLLVRFALSRATAESIRPWVDLSVDWPDKPRRFLSPVPVAPTGTSYVAVRRKGAPSGSRLRIEVEWEEHSRFRAAALKLDAAGRLISSVLVPSTPRATSAQITIAELDGVDTIVLAATNGGDRDRPFDPDDRVFEPHAYLLTIASE